MGGETLSSETVDTIEDGIAFDAEATGDGPDRHGVGQEIHDGGIWKRAFDVVVETEGLGGEGSAAESADESGDEAEGAGVMGSEVSKPMEVARIDGMEGTPGIGAEGGREGLRENRGRDDQGLVHSLRYCRLDSLDSKSISFGTVNRECEVIHFS